MKTSLRYLTQGALVLGMGLTMTAPAVAQTTPIWSDEFNGTRIDNSIWSYKVGGDGNGNGELQYYTARSEKPDSGFQFYPSAAELAANVDFLVAITPGGAGTKHLINAEVLKALGPRGFLINVARGSVVDEEALIAALQNGTIAGAGLAGAVPVTPGAVGLRVRGCAVA